MPVAPIIPAATLAHMHLNVDIPDVLKEIADDKVAQSREALGDMSPHLFDQPSISASVGRVFACSDFVAKTCIHHPGCLLQLVQDETLFNSLSQGAYHRILAQDVEPLYKHIDSGAMSAISRGRWLSMPCIAI